jgi:hypothetical protein
LNDTEERVLKALARGPLGVPEITAQLDVRGRSGSLKKALDRLTALNFVSLTLPDKPRSKNQNRELTPGGRRALSRMANNRRGS